MDDEETESNADVITETHKGVVYIDPSDLTVECNANSTLTTTKTGCKKFYIFDDSGDTYKMIMDRNTTAKVAWNSSHDNTTMNEIKTALDADTEGWVGNPRLIAADEIKTIVGNGSWSSSSATTTDYFYFGSKNTDNYTAQNASQKETQRSYYWLFDYTDGCESSGCKKEDSSTNGYWTSTGVYNSGNRVWAVQGGGYLNNDFTIRAYTYGVRPVIEVSKSVID